MHFIRSSGTSVKSETPPSQLDEGFETDMNLTDMDDDYSLNGSQYSYCSCSYCYESNQTTPDGDACSRLSFCER